MAGKPTSTHHGDLARMILRWFAGAHRALPWRAPFPRDPYLVLVSEVMLQQTQVERVEPAYRRFVARFPTITALAAAPLEEVLDSWSGLGYYRRARLLHRAAHAIVARGDWPANARGLQALPGFGAYTAAAVSAFALGGDAPPVDGNVARVVARLEAIDEPLGSAALQRRAVSTAQALHADAPGPAIFEALIELGATVCTPAAPRCDACPLAPACAARALGATTRLPRPRPRRAVEDHTWVALWLTRPDGRVLARRVDEGPLLRGLWLPPFAPLDDGDDAAAVAADLGRAAGVRGPLRPGPVVRHAITHRRIRVRPFTAVLAARRVAAERAGWAWLDPARPERATSSLFAKLHRSCQGGSP